jgi:hypothetical protein
MERPSKIANLVAQEIVPRITSSFAGAVRY